MSDGTLGKETTPACAASSAEGANLTAKLERKQLTEWWWALLWAGGFSLPAFLAGMQVGEYALGFGLFFGCLWGAIAMRLSIDGRRAAPDTSR